MTYIVKKDVKIGDRVFHEGDEVELEEKEAVKFVKHGDIELKENK